LASELRENGIDVILDKWDLKEGHDAVAFMEQMVTDPAISKVVIVCDQKYAEKANGRSGGVGTETQIISPEIYAQRDQEKFVVVVSEKDENGKPFLPTYYSSRIYIDLSDEAQYATNFDQLLRWVYDKPLHIKPGLGKKPVFLEGETSETSLGGATVARRALDAIRNNKGIWGGSLDDYFSRVAENLERFRIARTDGEFDDQVVESIEQFLPHRNEVVEIFIALSQYLDHEEVATKLHRFFEGIYEYTTRPETVTNLHAHLPTLNASGKLKWIHIGNEIDAYLGNDTARWAQWQTFFQAAKVKVRSLWGTGVSVSSIVQFSVLNDMNKKALYLNLLPDLDNAVLTYYPLNADFTVRPVSTVAIDFALMVNEIPDKNILLQECGYPSSSVNSSSETQQADFISAVFEAWDNNINRIRFIDLAWQYDVSSTTVDQWVIDFSMSGNPDESAFRAYLSTLGLSNYDSTEKAAMQRLRKELQARRWQQ